MPIGWATACFAVETTVTQLKRDRGHAFVWCRFTKETFIWGFSPLADARLAL